MSIYQSLASFNLYLSLTEKNKALFLGILTKYFLWKYFVLNEAIDIFLN